MIITFCGHRDFVESADIEERLAALIEKYARQSDRLICYNGGYGNFDYFAAKCVQRLQGQYSNIRNCLVLPYIAQTFLERISVFKNRFDETICTTTYRVAMSNYKNHVLPHFGDIPLSLITADKCQELLDRLIEEDKLRTEENVFSMLNMIFKAAVKHAVMKHNPIDMVFHTKHEREHGTALSKDEERKLLTETAGTPYQQMFAVGLYTGMRPNEYFTAKVEGEFIIANNSKRKNGKVELKKIPITPMLAPYVKDGEELKFYRLEQIRSKFNGILPGHKLYDLRTTFYTRCTECGIAEAAIKKYVGHTLGGLADTYTDLSDEFLLKEGKKFVY